MTRMIFHKATKSVVLITKDPDCSIRLAITTDGAPSGTRLYLEKAEAKKIADALYAAIDL